MSDQDTEFHIDENESEESIDSESSNTLSPFGKVKRLQTKVKDLEQKNRQYMDGWQKERAESINLRKRFDEERKSIIRYASEALILDLIPTIDNFESAFKNQEVWDTLPKNWTDGIKYIYSGLLQTLDNHGVHRLSPLGETFDPRRDEAIETVNVEKSEDDDKILDVIQTGYSLREKIIRHSRVKVGRYNP